jgi:hypothetical protein
MGPTECHLFGFGDAGSSPRSERLAREVMIERCAELGGHNRADRDRRDQAATRPTAFLTAEPIPASR